MKEPFDRNEAKKLVLKILNEGLTVFSRHAEEELAKDDLTTVDATNVLRAGKITEPAELERDTWRYRVHTERMVVVVSFVSESKLRIVTAWRKKK
ncbi:DUF4258 domain-containing protein [Melittangium boletus]|uniref:DUF4258 domain-containing protein n=1 Tax=Melittangium boletus DSM 14713 TaxID=1294270 RepID=A0A250ID05_9BACT|nr:DUF4258 domain-containing protein [Melittangium boletus]ATB29645.1 hypothetical protein MEBOL_003100 [Melittangium boletus DSM 14713]